MFNETCIIGVFRRFVAIIPILPCVGLSRAMVRRSSNHGRTRQIVVKHVSACPCMFMCMHTGAGDAEKARLKARTSRSHSRAHRRHRSVRHTATQSFCCNLVVRTSYSAEDHRGCTSTGRLLGITVVSFIVIVVSSAAAVVGLVTAMESGKSSRDKKPI